MNDIFRNGVVLLVYGIATMVFVMMPALGGVVAMAAVAVGGGIVLASIAWPNGRQTLSS